MSRPTSNTRWVASPSLPRLPCTSPTTCGSRAAERAAGRRCPPAPTCAVIWPPNCCSSSRDRRATASRTRARRPSGARVSISRWRTRQRLVGLQSAPPRGPGAAPRRGRAARRAAATRGARATASARPVQSISGDRASGGTPAAGRTARTRRASRRSRQSPDIRLWQSEKSYFTGSAGSSSRRRAVISSAIFQFRLRRRVSPIERAMFSMWVSTGISSARGGMSRQRPKSGGSRRTIQRRKRSSRLHGPPVRRPREPVAIPVGQPAAAGTPRRGPGRGSPPTKRSRAGPTCAWLGSRSRRRSRRRASRGARGARCVARQKATRSRGRLKR